MIDGLHAGAVGIHPVLINNLGNRSRIRYTLTNVFQHDDTGNVRLAIFGSPRLATDQDLLLTLRVGQRPLGLAGSRVRGPLRRVHDCLHRHGRFEQYLFCH